MKTIGLFYAMNAAKTSHIAEKIREDLGRTGSRIGVVGFKGKESSNIRFGGSEELS